LPGIDKIPTELIKTGGRIIFFEIHKLITSIWKKETLPEEWKESIIVPIHKKGDKTDCNNYRGISLLRTTYIFCIHQILEKKWEYNEEVHHLLIDYKKAYDSVRREVLYKILIQFGIPRKLVRLIKMNLTEMYSRFWVGKNVSDRSPIRNGLKQGDARSPMLFNFALEYAIRRVQINQDGLKLNGTHQLLAFADDVNILGRSIHTLKENAEALVAATREIGLEVSADKTKYIVMSRDQNAG